jgi:MFS family permease
MSQSVDLPVVEPIAVDEPDQPQSFAYAWYTVSLCTVAYILSQMDRQIIAMLIEPIRADLQITDTQFSLIHGLAFAIFYALMGIPIARLADSRSRPLIISVGIFVWSIATAVCGLARNFWQLFAARMAVGCGEAALSPAAYSMIADSFPRSKLGLALGVYSAGAFIGTGLAFLIGGTVIEIVNRIGELDLPVLGVLKPWQMTLFIVGLPGVILAGVFFVTVRDPERKGIRHGTSLNGQPVSRGFPIREIQRYLVSHRWAFAAHYLGFGCLAMALFALLFWSPAYLFRKYGLSAREAGIYLGFLVLLSNTAGVLSSGWLADYFNRQGRKDAAMRAGMVGGLAVIVPAALFSSVPGLYGTLAVLALAMYFASFPLPVAAAALQIMAPNQMRAQVTALFFLALNIVGITGGATLVALGTDYLFRDEQMVGNSISLVSAVAAAAGAALLAMGLKHYRRTVQDRLGMPDH